MGKALLLKKWRQNIAMKRRTVELHYIATGAASDYEMEGRIARHQEDPLQSGFQLENMGKTRHTLVVLLLIF